MKELQGFLTKEICNYTGMPELKGFRRDERGDKVIYVAPAMCQPTGLP
jgi:hypothetical protein